MATAIVFAQQKGGAGKTTLLTELAAHWAVAGRRVAVLDLDPQRSALHWGRLRAADPARAALALLGESADWRAASDIRDAAGLADLVLVDTAGRSEALGLALVERADLILVPCQPSMPDVWASEATLAAAAASRVRHLLVLNRCPPRGRAAEAAAAALARAGTPVAAARIGNRAGFAAAFAAGAGTAETAPSGKAAGEIAALAAEIEAGIAAGSSPGGRQARRG
jgi:chromosome partitioning protein